MPVYLTLEKAKSVLLLEGIITPLPSDEMLALTIDRIESYLDYWIGYRLAPTLYQEIVRTSFRGEATVWHYPILAVVQVTHIYNSLVDDSISAQQAKAIDPKSRGLEEYDRHKSTVYRDGKYVIDTSIRDGFVEVIYWAGLDPMPPMVEECLLLALTNVLQKGSVSFLLSPIKHVTSQSLPGGLSQSLKIPEFRDGEYSNMDLYFAPLQKYKRTLLF